MERITFRSGVFQLLSNTIIMPNNESHGKRRPFRYKSWNPTIAIQHSGNKSLIYIFLFKSNLVTKGPGLVLGQIL